MRIIDVVAMLSMVVILAVAVLVGAHFQNAISGLNLTSEAQSVISTVFNNLYTGLTIASIGIIVAAAVGIIALILGALAGPR